jgi:hypothetical protein
MPKHARRVTPALRGGANLILRLPCGRPPSPFGSALALLWLCSGSGGGGCPASGEQGVRLLVAADRLVRLLDQGDLAALAQGVFELFGGDNTPAQAVDEIAA